MNGIQEIRAKLQNLKARDNSARYDSHPVAQSEVELYEEEIAAHLPTDYRRFLLEIGWGAGPWLGLLSPREALNEIRVTNSFVFPEHWTEDEMPPSSRPFPFTRAQAEDSRRRERAGDNGTWLTHDNSPPGVWLGCVPVAYQGCDCWTALVTSGDMAGSVWDMYNHDAWRPARHDNLSGTGWPPLPAVVGFLKWYRSWLERIN